MPAAPSSENLADRLVSTMLLNPDAVSILERVDALALPNWRLSGGGVAQTVWNVQHGYPPRNAIHDYDLVYFDDSDLSYEAEDAKIAAAKQLFADLPIPVQLRNQARVHLWYSEHFGTAIAPYRSVEHAISTWPTTAAAVGVHVENGWTTVYAPFGLEDLFAMIVRPNKVQITREIYENKVRRWALEWPRLTVVPWDETDAGGRAH